MKTRVSRIPIWAPILLCASLSLYGAWTDLKPNSSPVTTSTSTCVGPTYGTCHKEQTDSCSCVDCPGLQEDLPNCDCKQESGTVYWQSWDGTCKGTHYGDLGPGTWIYSCEYPSEPQNSGDKTGKPTCGRET